MGFSDPRGEGGTAELCFVLFFFFNFYGFEMPHLPHYKKRRREVLM